MNEAPQDIESSVVDVIEAGVDVYEKVRQITLQALTERTLDKENIEQVTKAVGKGISKGFDSQIDVSRKVMQQATQALDDALVSTAEATKLAVEEAGSKIDEFNKHDLNQALQDLKSLEDLLLETMGSIAKESQGATLEIAEDLFNHAKTKGTAVGEQIADIKDELIGGMVGGEHSMLKTARETTTTLAEIGSGILAGIAESLQNKNKQD